MILTSAEIRRSVIAALKEDVGRGDVTTLATIPIGSKSTAVMRARQPMVVAGLAFAICAFRHCSSQVKVEPLSADGQKVKAGAGLLRITGPSRALLGAERVALNFIQRLSGVATLTASFVRAINKSSAAILDTRKTTPGWRRFEKYAVACGGGKNHRFGLYDLVLIKDNHLAALVHEKPNAIAAAVQRSRRAYPQLKIEVEVDDLKQAGQAVAAGADIILLDNMTCNQLRQAVKMIGGRAIAEASGGINLKNVAAIARTGVDYISVGAITHSAPAVDIGLDFLAD